MGEKALAVPFEANEIKEIVMAEFRKRLDMCSPLMGLKEYGSFDIAFNNVTIRLRQPGQYPPQGRDTLIWGGAVGKRIEPKPDDTVIQETVAMEPFTSKAPNTERLDRGMPLTVEVPDGRGGKTRKKVRMEKPGAKPQPAATAVAEPEDDLPEGE